MPHLQHIGSSWARSKIEAADVVLWHSHSHAGSELHLWPAAACGNERSLTHWARPGIKPTSSWRLCRVLNLLSHNGNPCYCFIEEGWQWFRFSTCIWGVPWWLSRFRICHCHCCGSGHCCGVGSIPDLGTFTCCGRGQNKTPKQTTKRTSCIWEAYRTSRWSYHMGRRQNVIEENTENPEDPGFGLCHLPALWPRACPQHLLTQVFNLENGSDKTRCHN